MAHDPIHDIAAIPLTDILPSLETRCDSPCVLACVRDCIARRTTMMLHKIRMACAAIILALSAGAGVSRASAQDLIEYALMAGFVAIAGDYADDYAD